MSNDRWNRSPDRGTMLMIICLEQSASRFVLKRGVSDLPAADEQAHSGKTSKPGIYTKPVSQSSIGMGFVVRGPPLHPHVWPWSALFTICSARTVHLLGNEMQKTKAVMATVKVILVHHPTDRI